MSTTQEKETSAEMHLFDGPSDLPIWRDEKVSLRQSESVPPDKALAQAEWMGSKIMQLHNMLLKRLNNQGSGVSIPDRSNTKTPR